MARWVWGPSTRTWRWQGHKAQFMYSVAARKRSAPSVSTAAGGKRQRKVSKPAPPAVAKPCRRNLVVFGLGNVGEEYAWTRHNVGFMVAEALATRWQLCFTRERSMRAFLATGAVGGRTVHVAKPTTLMNKSGDCVRRVLAEKQLQPAAALVVVDDVALPLGSMRLRLAGSCGGHNGLRDVERALGSRKYARLKVGVGGGKDSHDKEGLVPYVLGKFAKAEAQILPDIVDEVAKRVELWATHDDVQYVIQATNTKLPMT